MLLEIGKNYCIALCGNLSCTETVYNYSCPHTWYTNARRKKRNVFLHVGPTNSGKTYHALKQLQSSSSGISSVASLVLGLVPCRKPICMKKSTQERGGGFSVMKSLKLVNTKSLHFFRSILWPSKTTGMGGVKEVKQSKYSLQPDYGTGERGDWWCKTHCNNCWNGWCNLWIPMCCCWWNSGMSTIHQENHNLYDWATWELLL